MTDPPRRKLPMHPTEAARQWAITLWLIAIAGALAGFVILIYVKRYW
jgi:hypothetical protein